MTKRKKVFITSLIILILILAGGFYYLFFSGQLGTLADLVTGPNERVVASQKAQEIFDNAKSKINLQVKDDKLVLEDDKERGLLLGTLDVGEFDFIRRFLWEAEIPEGAELNVSIKTSADGQNWSEDWSKVSREGWYYINIQKPVSKIMYMVEFSKITTTYGADEETVKNQSNIYLDDANRDTDHKENEDGTVRKNLYAHLYISGVDNGRYLGAAIDNAGMASKKFNLILLTDKMAFVSPVLKTETSDFNNELTEFLTSGDIKVYFVDEAETNPRKRVKGEARLATRDWNSDEMETTVMDPNRWQEQGNYLTNIVDISGKHSDIYQKLQIVEGQTSVEADRDKKEPDLKYLKSGKDKPNKWQKFTTFNTKAYQGKDSVKELQSTSRMKYATKNDYIDVVADDYNAKLKVNNQLKGYYVGSGVNAGGKFSDIFYPIWMSNNEAWMGAGEYQRLMFFIPCKGGGDYSLLASFALGSFGFDVLDDVEGYIADGADSLWGSSGGGNAADQWSSIDQTEPNNVISDEQIVAESQPGSIYGEPTDGETITGAAVVGSHEAEVIDNVGREDIGLERSLPIPDSTLSDMYNVFRIIEASNPLIALGTIFAQNLIIDVADDILEMFFGDGPEVCGLLTPAQASAAYNRLASVYALRGVEPTGGDSAELSEAYEAFDDQNLQQLSIYVTVDEEPNDYEYPIDDGSGDDTETPQSSDESPALVQLGASSGYSGDDSDSDMEETVEQNQSGSASQIPGWVKGGLIKTGTDLIVLIVVTILVVIGLMYLVSLLRRKEDLEEVKEVK